MNWEQLELFDNLDLDLKIQKLEKELKFAQDQASRYRRTLTAFALGFHDEKVRLIASNALKQ